jgi:hypothetical protein
MGRRRTGTANRPNHSGKHHRHGLHVLALTDERGGMIWISAARPGRTHDITAARRDRILSHLRAAGLGALAELGFLGLDDDPDDPVVVTGFKAIRAASSPPAKRKRTGRSRPGRARLRPSQELADPHQAPHRSHPARPPCCAPCSS